MDKSGRFVFVSSQQIPEDVENAVYKNTKSANYLGYMHVISCPI